MEENKENNKTVYFFDKITKTFEIVIAFLLLVIIAIKFFDLIFEITSIQAVILRMDFEQILSIAFTLVIGVEFIKMLYKHTPETVIYVLLFAIARQIILYNEGVIHLLVGVFSIAGLFAVKKYLITRTQSEK